MKKRHGYFANSEGLDEMPQNTTSHGLHRLPKKTSKTGVKERYNLEHTRIASDPSIYCTTRTGVQFNHCMSPPVCQPVRGQLVKMLITLEPRGLFLSTVHTYACQHCLTTGMRKILFR